MREILNNILVIGHLNPDTDAAASAVSYAEYLNLSGRYERTAVGSVPGTLTPQAKYVFERAGRNEPLLVKSVVPRVGHFVNRNAKTLSSAQRVSDAVSELVRTDKSMLPIIGEDQNLVGIFSHRSDAARFLFEFDATNLWGSFLTADDLRDLRGMELVGEYRDAADDIGELRIAIEGSGGWRDDVQSADILICGDPKAVIEIPDERRPRCVVSVSGEAPDSNCVEWLNQRGVTVFRFDGSVAQFLNSLALQIRLECLSLPQGPCVGEFDPVEDVHGLLQDNHHAVPVLDEHGHFVGVISRNDVRDGERCKIILVDHFESTQSVAGVETAEVLEILDHHRVGDIETSSPIRVTCHPVGSASTIVATNFLDSRIPLDRSTATIILGGMVADTLSLKGPTTTSVDHKVGGQLASIAEVDLSEFGMDVLRAGDDLMTSPPETIWCRDQKQFTIQNQSFAVAQLETVSLAQLPSDTLDEYARLIHEDQIKNNRLLSLLVLTDVINGDSWIFSAEAFPVQGVAKIAFTSDEPRPGWISAPGVVSRKKQIVPRLMATLAKSQISATVPVG